MNTKFLNVVIAAGLVLCGGALAQTTKTESKLKPTETFTLKISGVPAEDVISISGAYAIAADGKFPLPYVGRITAGNLTASQLGMRIEKAYKTAGIFTRPTVNVAVAGQQELAIRRITINGEVKVPSRAAYSDGMTLLDAIASAGGFTDWADKGRVRLLRAGKTSSHDIRKISQNPELDVVLRPDDKIIVIHR